MIARLGFILEFFLARVCFYTDGAVWFYTSGLRQNNKQNEKNTATQNETKRIHTNHKLNHQTEMQLNSKETTETPKLILYHANGRINKK